MAKYNFRDDYSEGCHSSILDLLTKTNFEQQEAYGDDEYSQKARQLIRNELKSESADIHFVTGGTQANLIVISAILKPHQSVISASTGHINLHEAGAIEATGHKVNSIESTDGKIKTKDIQAVLDEHIIIPHMVQPKMVYISNSTEIGAVYTKHELENLSNFCKKKDLYLFLDGARLGSALCAENADLSLADLAQLTDIFYIGGTKNGALLGEAIVINNHELKEDFPFYMKQKGALLSKGRLLGLQFVALFENRLFFKLAKHANSMAQKMANALKQNGYSFLAEPVSNQIFPILPNQIIAQLEEEYGFYIWEKVGDSHAVIRLVTSWFTDDKQVNRFIKTLKKLS